MAKSEVIIFEGRKYARYPDSKHRQARNYFKTTSKYEKRSLHREIWKSVHGEIPEGFDIHHKDENTLNNDISNLECISKTKHKQEHHKDFIEVSNICVNCSSQFTRKVSFLRKNITRFCCIKCASQWHGKQRYI